MNRIETLYQDLARFGVNVAELKKRNPTELQLIDLVSGLEICHRATRKAPEALAGIVRRVNSGELVRQ